MDAVELVLVQENGNSSLLKWQNMDDLYTILLNALSADAVVRHPAETILVNMGGQPGFCKTMMGISMNPEVPVNVRLLGAICLKTTVRKHWNKASVASDKEKSYVRGALLNSFSCPHKPILMQMFDVVAGIVKNDLSAGNLESIFPTLVDRSRVGKANVYVAVENVSPPQQLLAEKHALQALNCALKVNGYSGRIVAFLTTILPRLIRDFFCHIRNALNIVNSLTCISAQTPAQLVLAMEITKVNLKCIFHCVMAKNKTVACNCTASGGVDSAQNEFREEIVLFLNGAVEVFCKIESALNGVNSKGGIRLERVEVMFKKIQNTIVRIVMVLHETSHVAFLPSIDQYLEFFVNRLVQAGTMVEKSIHDSSIHYLHQEKALVYAVQLVSNIVDRNIAMVEQSKQKFLEMYLSPLLHGILIFMSLNSREISEWESDPEQYAIQETIMTSGSNLRAASQTLYLGLLDAFAECVCSTVVKRLNFHQSHAFSSNQKNVRIHAPLLDGVYVAVGLHPYAFERHLDFGRWFTESLLPLLKTKGFGPNDPRTMYIQILQHRVLWLIGCILSELPDDIYAPLYACLLDLLEGGIVSSNGNAVLVLPIASALKVLIDRWGFAMDSFTRQIGIFGRFVSGLYSALSIVEEFESRSQILTIIKDLVERGDSDTIRDNVDVLTSPLLVIWRSCANQNLLRSSVLGILALVVEAMGPSDPSSYDIVYPLISYSIDIHHPEFVYLADDGISLWKTVMCQTPVYTESIHKLFQAMPALLKNDPMRIKVLSSISEAYILVGGSTFLVTFGSVLTDMLQYIFTQLQTKAHASALRIIELAISHSPREGCSILKNTIQQLLPVVVSELIPVLNETKAMSRANEIVLVQYLSLFARIRLQTPDIYSFFFTKPVPPNATVDMNKVFMLGLLRFFQKAGSGINGLWRQKRFALCLCQFLAEGNKSLLSKSSNLVHIFVDAMENVSSSEFYLSPLSRQDSEGMSREATERARLLTSDIVHQLDLAQQIKSALEACAQVVGVNVWQVFESSVQPALVRRLREHIL